MKLVNQICSFKMQNPEQWGNWPWVFEIAEMGLQPDFFFNKRRNTELMLGLR